MYVIFESREKCLERCQELESATGWNFKPVEYKTYWAVGFLSKPVLNDCDKQTNKECDMKQTDKNRVVNSVAHRYILSQTYLDWANNYISVSAFASSYGLSEVQAVVLIDLARDVHNSSHPES